MTAIAGTAPELSEELLADGRLIILRRMAICVLAPVLIYRVLMHWGVLLEPFDFAMGIFQPQREWLFDWLLVVAAMFTCAGFLAALVNRPRATLPLVCGCLCVEVLTYVLYWLNFAWRSPGAIVLERAAYAAPHNLLLTTMTLLLIAWILARHRRAAIVLRYLMVAVLLGVAIRLHATHYWFQFRAKPLPGNTFFSAGLRELVDRPWLAFVFLCLLLAAVRIATAVSAREIARRTNWLGLPVALGLIGFADSWFPKWSSIKTDRIEWLLFLTAAALGARSLVPVVEKLDRLQCSFCGYWLAGSDSARCPECGTERSGQT